MAKNRAITGGSQAEDGDANLPLNYVTGYGKRGARPRCFHVGQVW